MIGCDKLLDAIPACQLSVKFVILSIELSAELITGCCIAFASRLFKVKAIKKAFVQNSLPLLPWVCIF